MALKAVFRTVSFIACCVGVFVCIAMSMFTKAMHLDPYPIYFLGNGCLLGLAAFSHWYLDRLLTPKKPQDRTKA